MTDTEALDLLLQASKLVLALATTKEATLKIRGLEILRQIVLTIEIARQSEDV